MKVTEQIKNGKKVFPDVFCSLCGSINHLPVPEYECQEIYCKGCEITVAISEKDFTTRKLFWQVTWADDYTQDGVKHKAPLKILN